MPDTDLIKEKKFCRVCGKENLKKILSLGSTPPANAFLRKEDLQRPERFFPLELLFCEDCSFVQLSQVISPDLLFRDYVYVSSTSPVFVAHFESLAQELYDRLKITPSSLVVDLGSNDGVLLKPFKKMGMRILGVDPAIKIAEIANQDGIETMPVFFNSQMADEIVQKKGKAKVVTATSIFSHVDDLDDFIEGVKKILADDGAFVIEVYYLLDIIKKNLFDTIYHEHLSYFTIKTLDVLFKRLAMEIFDVKRVNTHGGSIRVFAQKKGGKMQVQDSVEKLLQEEREYKLDVPEIYGSFFRKIEQNKIELIKVLRELKSQGKRIVGYGAPAKGNTLLNYFGIGPDLLDYIVDDSVWKQSLYTPGTHIPVVASDRLVDQKPDYVLILAWNFSNSIINKFNQYAKFIIPVPGPQVVNSIVEQDLQAIASALQNDYSKLEGKTLVITGGSGFLGSYIVALIEMLNKNFLKKLCKVISIDNHIVGSQDNLIKKINCENIIFMEHNVCVPFKIDGPVDYIINAAGVASPVYYKKFPIETIEGTIFGLKNTLELAREKKVKSILYFSSSEIYGDPDPNFIPTPETYKGNVSSIGPRSCYDESKRLGETLAMAYYDVHKTPIKIVRPFNVYGPGMKSTDYRVIPTFLSQGLKGEPLTVHERGNQTRTFCYITDAIIGIFKVLLSDKNGEVYNVGNDNDEINMKGLADLVKENVFNNQVQIRLVNYPETYPQDEPRRRKPNLTKIKKDLNYQPTVDLKEGIIRSFLWFKDNSN